MIRRDDGSWEFQSGLGDIDFFTNIIGGKSTDDVGLRYGWQVGLGELLVIRRGSMQGSPTYTTDGFSVRLAGALKAIGYFMGDGAPGWLRFARDHVDLQYHNASHKGETIAGETTFQGITLVVTGLQL